MAFASFLTTKRVLAFTIGAAAASTGARLVSSRLDTLRLNATRLETLTAQAIDASVVRMSEKLHRLAADPAIQRNLQWNYANSVSQTLAATERSGEVDHLSIIDNNCQVIANSKRQNLDSTDSKDHWKPVCENSKIPDVTWIAKNETPVIQIALPVKTDLRDHRSKPRWIVGQVALSEGWIKQHSQLDRLKSSLIPEASIILGSQSGPPQSGPRWTPLPWRLRLGSNLSQSIVQNLATTANASALLTFLLLVLIFLRSSRLANRSEQTTEKNRQTLDQLITNAATDDETKLSFSIGYAATALPTPGDMTPDLIALDRLHRNRFAMSRMDMKEKDLWVEDLQCQLSDAQEELTRLRHQMLRHVQNEMIHDGLAKKIISTCRAIAQVHDDIHQQCNEPFIGLSNLIAGWKHGAQSMGLKRFTRYLQESTDELSRRSDLETGLLILTSIQEQAFSTLFELPSRLKQCIQDLRPTIKTLNAADASLDSQCSTTLTMEDILHETSQLLNLASQSRKIIIRPCPLELKTQKVGDSTAQVFIKWLFYRCLRASLNSADAATTYVNIRGKQSTDSLISLQITFFNDRHGKQSDRSSWDEEQKIQSAMDIADKLAIAQGIDWQDRIDKKVIASSVNQPAIMEPSIMIPNQLNVRLPVIRRSEGRKDTPGASKMVGVTSVSPDFGIEESICPGSIHRTDSFDTADTY